MNPKYSYEKESKIIIDKMLNVLIRAQRKIDDKNYRKTLYKFENLENGS